MMNACGTYIIKRVISYHFSLEAIRRIEHFAGKTFGNRSTTGTQATPWFFYSGFMLIPLE